MKHFWWWISGATVALLVIVAIIIMVPRQPAHATRLAITLYCQGELFFPTAQVSSVGTAEPCRLDNDEDAAKPVVIQIYHQSCVLALTGVRIPTMQPTTFMCAIPGASRFTPSDDAAMQAEVVGQCMTDDSFMTQVNSPCRLFVVGMEWRA